MYARGRKGPLGNRFERWTDVDIGWWKFPGRNGGQRVRDRKATYLPRQNGQQIAVVREEKKRIRVFRKKGKVRTHLGNIHTYIKYGPAQLYMYLDSLKFYKLLLPAWLEGKQLKVDTVRGPRPAKTGKSAAKSRNGDVRSCYVTESLPTVI